MIYILAMLMLVPVDDTAANKKAFLSFAKSRHESFLSKHAQGEFEWIMNTSQMQASIRGVEKVRDGLYVSREAVLVTNDDGQPTKLSNDQIRAWQTGQSLDLVGKWKPAGICCSSEAYDFRISHPSDGKPDELQKIELFRKELPFDCSERRGGLHVLCVGDICGNTLLRAIERDTVEILSWDEHATGGPKLSVAYTVAAFNGPLRTTIHYQFDNQTALVKNIVKNTADQETTIVCTYSSNDNAWLSEREFKFRSEGKLEGENLLFLRPFTESQVDSSEFNISTYGFPEPVTEMKAKSYPWAALTLLIVGVILVGSGFFIVYRRKKSKLK